MADVFGHFSYTYLDDLGKSTSAPVYVLIDDASTIADVVADMNDLATDLDAVSDSQITEMSFRLIPDLPGGLKSAPVDTAENSRTAVFNFSQNLSPYKAAVQVPSIADSKIVAGEIDLTDADIVTLTNFLVLGGAASTFVSTAIRALESLLDALLSFRKRVSTRTISTP